MKKYQYWSYSENGAPRLKAVAPYFYNSSDIQPFIKRGGIKKVQVKSVLTKSNLPKTDFVINPYIGCQHACVYCYARFMKRFTNHKEPWGSFVDVKINAAQILEKQLQKYKNSKYKSGQFTCLLSSVTDPYQQLEEKYRLTRSILNILKSYPQFNIEILTKSDLILRDIAIIKLLKNPSVTMSIGITNDKDASVFEPQASLPSKRIAALKKIHQKGIKTAAFISPILPFFTDFDKICSLLKDKVDKIYAETLNPKGANFIGIKKVLKAHHPQYQKEYQKIFFSSFNKAYLNKTKQKFIAAAKKYNILVWGFFTH